MPHLQNVERDLPLHWALNPIRIPQNLSINTISLYRKISRNMWRCCTQLCNSPKFQRYVRFLESSLCQF
ncbi:uncharacterized protein LOC128256569 [Drosophila gunungcola]|uniref:uncharacterized protein LOC128256569 n=1 Tax=Drosophila gunungcola TaxID=103775 RepID=UPI0022DF14ED|nr:uncharacterized protein LOC128256569 [Drosophila gunungcola]